MNTITLTQEQVEEFDRTGKITIVREDKQWEPPKGEWRLTGWGHLHQESDEEYRVFGNLFKTAKQAQSRADAQKESNIIHQYALEHNGDWVADWGDNGNNNHCVMFYHGAGKWVVDAWNQHEVTGQSYMPGDVATELCRKLNAGLIKGISR
jgi:hypothetical protein